MSKASIRRRVIAGGLTTASMMQRLKLMQDARGRGAIFTLHHVRPYQARQPDPNRHLEITPQFLATALRTLWRENYEFIALDQVPERLAAPSSTRPFAAFTLDDAYRNTQTMALPIFEHFEAPCTVFACQGLSNRSHTLWWETLAALVRKADHVELSIDGVTTAVSAQTTDNKQHAFEQIAQRIAQSDEAAAIHALNALALHHGINSVEMVEDAIMSTTELRDFASHPLVTLGAHSVSHRALTKLSNEDLAQDILDSVDYIEGVSGERPTSFAYPYGDARSVDERTAQAVRDAGLKLAVTTKPGTLNAHHQAALYTLPRISLNGYFQTPQHVNALASGIPFKLFRQG
ncbi:polysaccharide deacetylase family protein [Rhizobium oryziradicis]|nr:polysaccharide deacetylase family protein [Rhizobium oryziradicis]